MFLRSTITLLLLATGILSGRGQVQIRSIVPSETQSSIAVVHGPHRVSAPELKNRRMKLVVSIAGTGGDAKGFDRFDSVATAAGYHAISLDYKNEVITTICLPSLDSMCYDSFRSEIVFGTPVSDKVQVDSTNSIYNRLYRLLEFLAAKYPQEGWGQFLKDRKINWVNVTAAGHSQGAGHAAFLGKHFPLSKVIILAGPQDFLEHFGRPAPWISGHSATAPDRFVALLNPRDPYGFEKQLSSCLRLSGTNATDTLSAESLNPKKATANILVTHIRDDNPHGSVMLVKQAEVWRYMLGK